MNEETDGASSLVPLVLFKYGEMKVPVVRQHSYWALAIHSVIIAGLVVCVWWSGGERSDLIGILLLYWALSFSLKGLVARWQGKGMRLIKRGNYEEAIECFQRSYDYFERYRWVDKFRFITLLSCSRVSYREMALCNIAFCYGQLGEGEKAVRWYQKTLEQFPDSMIARMNLNVLNPLIEKCRKQEEVSGTV